MRAFFVTGTDTEVGKTHVSVGLLQEAGRRGLATAAMKPAETGCATAPGGGLVAAEAARLAAAATVSVEESVVCPYRYREPAAPVVAARSEGGMPELGRIRDCFETLVAAEPDLLLVEGAGGLLVGVNDTMSMADLAGSLGLALIVVARDGLGTLNHTLLTVEAAARRGLEVAAVVLNGVSPDTDPRRAASNLQELRSAGVPVTQLVAHGTRDLAITLDHLLTPGSVPRGTVRR